MMEVDVPGREDDRARAAAEQLLDPIPAGEDLARGDGDAGGEGRTNGRTAGKERGHGDRIRASRGRAH